MKGQDDGQDHSNASEAPEASEANESGGAENDSTPALTHEETIGLLRRNLKILLFHLAKGSESPSTDLENLLQDVIYELYTESKEALEDRKKHLRLVAQGG